MDSIPLQLMLEITNGLAISLITCIFALLMFKPKTKAVHYLLFALIPASAVWQAYDYDRPTTGLAALIYTDSVIEERIKVKEESKELSRLVDEIKEAYAVDEDQQKILDARAYANKKTMESLAKASPEDWPSDFEITISPASHN